MDILEAIRSRKSVRGFKPDPISKETLKEILESAIRAPSAMNTQPWEFIVLTGEVLEKIKLGNLKMLKAGRMPQPEHHVVGWSSGSVYRYRQVELAKHIFYLMDIPRHDMEKRTRWLERGFRFFDAPVAIIISFDSSLSESGPLLDIGAVMQNICLSAMAYGLATCIEDQGIMYPEVVREFTNIPVSKKIIISIAIGYPEWDFPANKLETAREPVDSITTWYGFK